MLLELVEKKKGLASDLKSQNSLIEWTGLNGKLIIITINDVPQFFPLEFETCSDFVV